MSEHMDLELGHPLKTPDGREIRVPAWAFPKLKKLGLLEGNKAQLSPSVYAFLSPDFDPLTGSIGSARSTKGKLKIRRPGNRFHRSTSGKGKSTKFWQKSLRVLLGPDLSGPTWVMCTCNECRAKRGQL